MNLIWLDSFLVYGLFSVVMVMGLALLLHLQLGLARIANFGVVGFWGLGMYVFGIMYTQIDWAIPEIWAFLISMAAATIVAGIAGLAIGWVISDLDIDGVLVGTLGFATCVWILATTEKDLTGGALGMGGLGFPYDIGSVKANETLWLVILVVVVALILYYVSRVHKSPYGRTLIAIGDNEPLIRSLGKQSFRRKLWLFAGTSAAMGLLGAMFGVMERFLSTGNLGISVTLAAIVGLIVGGTTRTWGAIAGVAVTVAVFDIIIQSYIPLPQDWYGQAIPVLRQMVFGLALILILMFRPHGMLGPMRRDKLMRRMHDG